MIPETPTAASDIVFIPVPDRPLAREIVDYLNHLAAQTPKDPLTLSILIHPLNIAEGLAHEFAAHERALAGEKGAAHELVDPFHPRENAAARRELCNLIAEMTAPLAEATFAHHLMFILTFGKDIPPPYAVDRLALCASFDGKHGIMRQHFAPDRETAPPPDEAIIPIGVTMICEPLEAGYYRLPDDSRHRQDDGLLMSDPIYRWTLQSLIVLYLGMANYNKLGTDERETLIQIGQQLRSLFRLLALAHPGVVSFASLGGLNWQLLRQLNPGALEEMLGTYEKETEEPKTVVGHFAGASGGAQPRNVEHRAAGQLLERHEEQSHHPQQPHVHAENPELQPE